MNSGSAAAPAFNAARTRACSGGARPSRPLKDGEVICLSASDTFKDLGHSPLDDKCYATPAIAGDRLIIRTASHLMATK